LISTLTAREHDVLRLLGYGYTAKDIGIVLGIAPGTVKNHLKEVYRKMGVSSRMHAVLYGLERGWLVLPRTGE
jgi:DNA-binding CsgD family transcriptional regulator